MDQRSLPFDASYATGPSNPSALCSDAACPALAPCPIHMTESSRTAALLKSWRTRHPKGLARKINDATSAGEPDAMFIDADQGFGHRVTFVEFKLPKRGEADLSSLSAIQKVVIREYDRAGANIYVGVFQPNKRLRVYIPYGEGFDLVEDGPEAAVIDKCTNYSPED